MARSTDSADLARSLGPEAWLSPEPEVASMAFRKPPAKTQDPSSIVVHRIAMDEYLV